MIITETTFSNIITEATEEGKNLYIKGVFMESEKKNRNGRQYLRSEIEKAVQKVNEAAKGHPILGELDHPSTLEVRLENVSHQIVEMYMQGDDAIGKALILPTPKGQIARSLIEAGVPLGVSSRGSGSVNESTGIVEGFDLVTVDIVANPSAINAYPESVYEHLEFYKRGEMLESLAEAVVHDEAAQKYFKREMLKFIEDLFQ